jgi:hypothetical protein
VIYFSVKDIDGTLRRVRKSGGRTFMPKTRIGEYGSIAQFEDTEGNRLALHAIARRHRGRSSDRDHVISCGFEAPQDLLSRARTGPRLIKKSEGASALTVQARNGKSMAGREYLCRP